MLGLDLSNLNYKKILLILGLLVVAIALAFLLYWVFFRTTSTPITETNTNANQNTSGGLTPSETGNGQAGVQVNGSTGLTGGGLAIEVSDIAKGGVTYTEPITAEASQFVTWSNSNQDLIYYNPQTSQFYRVGNDGQSQLLTDQKFYNVSNVVWSPNQDKAIMEYPDGSKIVYNFNTDQQVSLPKHWEDFSFSPTGDQIAAKSLGLDPSNRWLIVTSDDGSQAKQIEPLGENESIVTVDWSPNNQVIATYIQGVDFDRQDLFFVGLNNENFKKTTVEGRGFEGLWTPQGDRMLYSVYNSGNDLKPELWVVDAQGDNIGNDRRRLNIETWANKCTFATDSVLYCGVPQTLEKGSGLFPQLANTTTDDIYRIDLKTGGQEKIAETFGSYSVSQLIVSPNQDYLYFNDARTGQIYKIRLK